MSNKTLFKYFEKANANKVQDNTWVQNDNQDNILLKKKQSKSMKIMDQSQQSIVQLKTPQTNNKPIKTPIKSTNNKQQINFTDKTPQWALPPHLRDKNKKKINDPGYDASTIFVPPNQYSKMTNTMKQYWDIKSQNFDKIIMFKLGKFYELFYQDAAISHQILDLNWMGNKMHTGFPQKGLEKYCKILVEKGYKIVIVQQMETPAQMEKRYKQDRNSGKFIKRQVTQIITQGTYNPIDNEQYFPKFLLCFRIWDNKIGITLLDTSTNQIIIGLIKDDQNFNQFKTMLCKYKPIQILYDPQNITQLLMKILKSRYLNAIFSPQSNRNKVWHHGYALNKLDNVYGEEYPQIINNLCKQENYKQLVLSSLAGCFYYTQKLIISDKILSKNTRYYQYNPKLSLNFNMILDSQALQHLQILHTNYLEGISQKGSLFTFLDFTCSKFGKRKLRNWICSPLINLDKIRNRLDAIQDLQNIYFERQEFRQALRKTPDLQRILSKIYQYSIKNAANQAIYFSDVNANRFKQLKQTLNHLSNLYQKVRKLFSKNIQNFTSRRLKKLVLPQDMDNKMEQQKSCQSENKEGILPNIILIVQETEHLLDWTTNPPTPPLKLCQDYAQIKSNMNLIKQELNNILKKYIKILKDHTLQFTHSKNRYQIQVPKHNQNFPPQFQFSSSRNGFQRYLTPQIRESVKKLQILQQKQKKCVNAYSKQVFFYFTQYKVKLDTFIDILSQLDALCSLSYISYLYNMTRPNFTQENLIKILEGKHPCLMQKDKQCVPNSVILSKQTSKSILLTGPNMGGKSTFLRMSCLIIIMAQIGCFVPAKYYQCCLIDRIFTRLGASDSLIDGKSTFLIQMEQTKNIIQYASKNSLAIIDQLGRGTSTYDGISIAYSVLKHLLENNQCFTLFATHYHILLQQFKGYDQIKFCHMLFQIDDKNEKIINFLYKLGEGGCNNSMGMNVGRIAGIEEKILLKAQMKSEEFMKNLQINRQLCNRQKYEYLRKVLKQYLQMNALN